MNKMGQKDRLYVEYMVQSIRICAHLMVLGDKGVLKKVTFLKLKNHELFTDTSFAHYNFNPYPMYLKYRLKSFCLYIAPCTTSKWMLMPVEDDKEEDTWFMFPYQLMDEMLAVINSNGYIVQEGDVFCANKEIYQPWPIDYLSCVQSTGSPGGPKSFAGTGRLYKQKPHIPYLSEEKNLEKLRMCPHLYIEVNKKL